MVQFFLMLRSQKWHSQGLAIGREKTKFNMVDRYKNGVKTEVAEIPKTINLPLGIKS